MAKTNQKLEAKLAAMGFVKTQNKVTFTFAGWDGKSYDGEGQTKNIYTHPMIKGEFIVAWAPAFRCYCIHKVSTDIHPKSGLPKVYFHYDFTL